MSTDQEGPEEAERLAVLIDGTAADLCGGDARRRPILDFGCGVGHLVRALGARGYDAHGCDIHPAWKSGGGAPAARLRPIARDPYRLPYDDGAFGLVVSTSVLEHAQNTEECFREIRRVLAPGGWAVHLYPSQWYLPCEPHMFVPLANFFWPDCPRWWYALWALLGRRSPYQGGMAWRAVIAQNLEYSRAGVCYRSNGTYRRIAREVFGNCDTPNHLYVRHAQGGFARLARRLPFPRLTGWVTGTFRMSLLVMRRTP